MAGTRDSLISGSSSSALGSDERRHSGELEGWGRKEGEGGEGRRRREGGRKRYMCVHAHAHKGVMSTEAKTVSG